MRSRRVGESVGIRVAVKTWLKDINDGLKVSCIFAKKLSMCFLNAKHRSHIPT